MNITGVSVYCAGLAIYTYHEYRLQQQMAEANSRIIIANGKLLKLYINIRLYVKNAVAINLSSLLLSA